MSLDIRQAHTQRSNDLMFYHTLGCGKERSVLPLGVFRFVVCLPFEGTLILMKDLT